MLYDPWKEQPPNPPAKGESENPFWRSPGPFHPNLHLGNCYGVIAKAVPSEGVLHWVISLQGALQGTQEMPEMLKWELEILGGD